MFNGVLCQLQTLVGEMLAVSVIMRHLLENVYKIWCNIKPLVGEMSAVELSNERIINILCLAGRNYAKCIYSSVKKTPGRSVL